MRFFSTHLFKHSALRFLKHSVFFTILFAFVTGGPAATGALLLWALYRHLVGDHFGLHVLETGQTKRRIIKPLLLEMVKRSTGRLGDLSKGTEKAIA